MRRTVQSFETRCKFRPTVEALEDRALPGEALFGALLGLGLLGQDGVPRGDDFPAPAMGPAQQLALVEPSSLQAPSQNRVAERGQQQMAFARGVASQTEVGIDHHRVEELDGMNGPAVVDFSADWMAPQARPSRLAIGGELASSVLPAAAAPLSVFTAQAPTTSGHGSGIPGVTFVRDPQQLGPAQALAASGLSQVTSNSAGGGGSTSGSTTCNRGLATLWNPTQFPTSFYTRETLTGAPIDQLPGAPINWSWMHMYPVGSSISQVLVAPPINASDPYLRDIPPDSTGHGGHRYDFTGGFQSNCHLAAQNQAWVEIHRPGVYVIQVTYSGGVDTRVVYAGAAPFEKPNLEHQDGLPMAIMPPVASAGAFLIENPPAGRDNGADAIAATIFPTAVRTTSVGDTIHAVQAASARAGGAPVDVVMFGHGARSIIGTGDGIATVPGAHVQDGLGEEVQFVQAPGAAGAGGVKGLVRSIRMLSCSVAQDVGGGQGAPPTGHLMNNLAQNLRTVQQPQVQVSAYDKPVYAVSAYQDRYGVHHAAYIGVAMDATWVTV